MFGKLNDKHQPDCKFFNLRHGIFKIAVTSSFICLIPLVFSWMYRSYYFTNPFVPQNSDLRGSQLYGRNMEGDLYGMNLFFTIEILVVLVVLLPYSFSRYYWVRLLILQCAFGFWSLILTITAMHSSSLYVINLVGVVLIDCLIFFWMISTFVAEQKNKTAIYNEWNNRQPNN